MIAEICLLMTQKHLLIIIMQVQWWDKMNYNNMIWYFNLIVNMATI